MTAIAVYFLLSVLGIAIGATISYRTGETDFSMGAAIWAIITLMVSRFCGGCVASKCTTGESKAESVIYGVVLWGTMFTMLVWLMASRINVGFVDVMGVASSGRLTQAGSQVDEVDNIGGAQGMTDQDVRQLRHDYPNAFASSGTWPIRRTTCRIRGRSAPPGGPLAAFLSMSAAISGALTGAGPYLYFGRFPQAMGFQPASHGAGTHRRLMG